MSTGASPGPVQELRVVEIGDLGEVAGKLLADAGADVIRVEPPSGSAARSLGPFVGGRPGPDRSLRYAYFNTSKRGVTLELGSSEGRELWWRLSESADVVIDAAGRGVLDALDAGFGHWAGHAGLERSVWCSITPFGREGPRADWAANDLVHIALGGPMMSSGYDDHELPPIRPGYEHSLWMAGEYAVCGTLAARIALEGGRVEGPELVDLSIHEAVSCTTEGAFPNWEYRRELVQRQTGRHSSPEMTSPWQFPTADGRYINIIGGGMPRDLRTFNGLLDWMEKHDAVEDLRDPEYRAAISRASPTEQAHFGSVVERFLARISAGRGVPWRAGAAPAVGGRAAAGGRTSTTRTGKTAASSTRSMCGATRAPRAFPRRPIGSRARPFACEGVRHCLASTTTRSTATSSG